MLKRHPHSTRFFNSLGPHVLRALSHTMADPPCSAVGPRPRARSAVLHADAHPREVVPQPLKVFGPTVWAVRAHWLPMIELPSAALVTPF